MQRHCRPRLYTAPKDDDDETVEIDNVAQLFAQYAKSAPLKPAKPVRSARILQSITFANAEDSDEAAANWKPGTVPRCDKWLVFVRFKFVVFV